MFIHKSSLRFIRLLDFEFTKPTVLGVCLTVHILAIIFVFFLSKMYFTFLKMLLKSTARVLSLVKTIFTTFQFYCNKVGKIYSYLSFCPGDVESCSLRRKISLNSRWTKNDSYWHIFIELLSVPSLTTQTAYPCRKLGCSNF